MERVGRLAFVGNLEDGVDKSDVVESFDFVVRVNRMNNFGLTGTRTDLLLVDATPAFFSLVNLNEYKDRVERHVKSVVVNSRWPSWRDLLPERLVKTAKLIHNIREFCMDLDGRFDGGNVIPTNSFNLLWYLIKNGYSDRYSITVFNENPRRFLGVPADPSHEAAAPVCLEWYMAWADEGRIEFEGDAGASIP